MVNDFFLHFVLRQNLFSKFRSRVLLLQIHDFTVGIIISTPYLQQSESKRREVIIS